MSSEITIVTAFFDIGRGDWTQSVIKNGGNLPHYLERSAETYIARFETMCKLDNELIVYTTRQYAGRLEKMRKDYGKEDKTRIVIIDYPTAFPDRLAEIAATQQADGFIERINPAQARNPEYWSPDYVMVTNLKAYFVADAVKNGYVSNPVAAWLDFGYCRSDAALNGKTSWQYDFADGKIHYFNSAPITDEDPNFQVARAVQNNHVVIYGCSVVAEVALWEALAVTMEESLNLLIDNGLVDDDQGCFLISYFSDPSTFTLHSIDYNDPFIVFRDYNDSQN